MNKQELAEIKKQFKSNNNERFVVNLVRTYYVKDSDMITLSTKKKYAGYDALDNTVSSKVYLGTSDIDAYNAVFKKTLGGQLGKSLVEYSFPNDVMTNPNSNYAKLLNLVKTNMADDADAEEYAHIIIKDINMESDNYIIIMQHCSYSVPTKSKDIDGAIDEELDDIVYNFILVSICDGNYPKLGLIYNESKDDIESGESNIMEFKAPRVGFLFPSFNDRNTDVNSVLCYDKKYKEPNKSFIENILECNFTLNAEEEKDVFNTLVAKIVTGDDCAETAVDYDIVQNIHSQIYDIIKSNVAESEIPKLGSYEVKSILRKSGVSDDKLKEFDEVYEETVGDIETQLTAVNVIGGKLNLKNKEIVINVNSDKTDKVKSQIVDGKKCLVVELDDTVEVNGLSVTI